jgi:fumarate reductase subunit C
MIREMTSLFIGIYSAVLVIGLVRLAQGQSAWEGFLMTLSSTPGVLVQLVCLLFATYHSVTWFALTPKAMPVMVRGQPVSAKTIIRVHYAVWVAMSLIVLIAAGA